MYVNIIFRCQKYEKSNNIWTFLFCNILSYISVHVPVNIYIKMRKKYIHTFGICFFLFYFFWGGGWFLLWFISYIKILQVLIVNTCIKSYKLFSFLKLYVIVVPKLSMEWHIPRVLEQNNNIYKRLHDVFFFKLPII